MAAALRRSLNKAKLVAPDPDIPVTLASGIWESLSSTLAIGAATLIAAACRSLRPSEGKSKTSVALLSTVGRGRDSKLDMAARSNAAKTFDVGA
jgi:hypothetical protein